MKTAEQIAARVLEIYSEKWRDEYGERPLSLPIDDAAIILIAGAIEGDRVQRDGEEYERGFRAGAEWAKERVRKAFYDVGGEHA